MTVTELFLVSTLVIFGAPYIVWRLLGRSDWAPLVVVQIIGGILLGPNILGSLAPSTYGTIMNPQVLTAINGIAWWAIMLFVWIAGIELDLREAWRKRGETGTVAAFALLMPLTLGSIAASVLMPHFNWAGPNSAPWQVVVGVGMSCSVTALPILILLMENMAILRTGLGQRILRYASLDDVAIWAVLSLILIDVERLARQSLFFVLFVPFSMIIRKLISSAKDEDRWIYGLLWLALCSLGADWAGLHYMVGAFLSGAVLDSKWFKIEKMDAFRNNILISIMPFYFLSTGLKTTWEMGGAGAFVAAGILLAVSVAAKILGMVASGRILKWELSESLLIGWLLQTKALILIIFITALLDKGIITSDLFTTLLLVAIGSTMLTMPIVTPMLAKGRHILEKA